MNVLSHKGYQARIEFDGEYDIFVGRIAGIDDVVSFHADSAEGLKVAFHEDVDDYREIYAKAGKAPQKS